MQRLPGTVPLSSVTTWLSGGTPNRAVPSYWNGSIPWISAATLKRSKIADSDQHLTDIGVRAGSRLAPRGATLVLVRGMALHRETRIGMATCPVSFNQDVKALIPKRGILSEFLLYAIQARTTQILDLVSSAGSGTGVLDTNLLQRLPVWIPEEAEQRAIIGAIQSVDDTVDALGSLIAKRLAVKQYLTQQLLTCRTRTAGFDGAWKARRVAEMGAVLAGKALNITGPGKKRPYLRTKNVLDGEIRRLDILHMPMTDAEFERFRLKRGDVLLNEGQSLDLVGRCSLYQDDLGVTCAMQNQLLRFRTYEWTSPRFATQLFRNCQASGAFAAIATQTTSVAHLGSSRFSNLRLLWPTDRREQAAIAEVLDDADREIAALRSRLVKTRSIKLGMMQQLLTGRTRLR